MEKKYWKSISEYKNGEIEMTPEFSVEGLSEGEVKNKMVENPSRRNFLKTLGFGVGYAALAASCDMPIRNAIPFMDYPDHIKAGIPAYYASTYFDGSEYCSVLVKQRDGRPIKIEGNDKSLVTKGGTSARVQASVMSLYDQSRLQAPQKAGATTDWPTVDKEIAAKLQQLSGSDKKIVILSGTELSPSTKQLFQEFAAKYQGTEVIYYDAVSLFALRKSHELTFGQAILPTYDFSKAKVVVSFGADFLGTWLSPVEFSKQFAQNRKVSKVKGKMSKHIHFEGNLSLTGSNADVRIPIKPSQEKTVVSALYNEFATNAGLPLVSAEKSPVDVKKIAKELLQHKGASLVVSGSNDVTVQVMINGINQALGNYGTSLNLQVPSNYAQGNDEHFSKLIGEMNGSKVGALFLINANPIYNSALSKEFESGLAKVDLSVAFVESEDETSSLAKYTLPVNHYLESWGDASPKAGSYSLVQPTINPLFNTRQLQESLMKWAGIEGTYYEYIKKYWQEKLFTVGKYLTSDDFWNHSLQDGVYEIKPETVSEIIFKPEAIEEAAKESSEKKTGIEAIFYQKVGIADGKHANNPWLQELPDPITKATWDNYITIPVKYAEENGIKTGDFLNINKKFDLPVIVQPGQTNGTVGIALGYGRKKAGTVAEEVGQNASELTVYRDGSEQYWIDSVALTPTGRHERLGLTQEFADMQGREIVRETTLSEYLKDDKSGNEFHFKVKKHHTTMYPEPDFPGHHWGLSIDMNSCTGCSACVIACQAENNIAVIGKEEVANRRIMHWIRLDRYYEGDPENPSVLQQPVMCQHCDNAPCENVCPVAATPHSNEGLNQMAYNRCIGTRYCMNNCPYRVRRFNWYEYTNSDKFNYNQSNDLGRMQLNPDVVVRSRGVVEKCSLCVQRIQDGKLTAKKENRQLRDGEIKTACMQACASDAIEFGDLNNKESKVFKAMSDNRNYNLLEELHTLPSVGYLTKVRNADAKPKADKHDDHA